MKENDKSVSEKVDRALPVKRKEIKAKQSADAKGRKLSGALDVDDNDDAWEMPDTWQAAVITVEEYRKAQWADEERSLWIDWKQLQAIRS